MEVSYVYTKDLQHDSAPVQHQHSSELHTPPQTLPDTPRATRTFPPPSTVSAHPAAVVSFLRCASSSSFVIFARLCAPLCVPHNASRASFSTSGGAARRSSASGVGYGPSKSALLP